MAQCESCKGTIMVRCKKCAKLWCADCSREGKPPYPKWTDQDKCPYCGAADIEPLF
ncbi:MAG: hydrogenase maturation nickel metallochaperone HypA [Deltaproteobacteria bacterium]|nr:hydrogenase maturation nickel metallochaperone HypA [Deltaproteobacteria bacterium]